MFSRNMPDGTSGLGGAERYLGRDEPVVYVTRRHFVVLIPALAVWLGSVVVGLASVLLSHGEAGSEVRPVGGLIFLAGSAFLGWKVWRWWMARHVFTDERVVVVDGIYSQRVNGLPLKMVLDTTFHQTFVGRLLGYCDLELNLSGQPGLRKLTLLPRPDQVYQLVLRLMDRRVPPPPPPEIRSVR